MKIKIFYSYSHKDEDYREELEKHLAILRDKKLIDEWHDRNITAGDDWIEEIDNHMEQSHIILLLFSPDFISSTSCKKEIDTSLSLKRKKNTILIPIILRACSWKDLPDISNIQALPKNATPIKSCADRDAAWQNVYEGIKKQVNIRLLQIKPEIKEDFKNELSQDPIINESLNKLFVYPDIAEINKDKSILEQSEINSSELKNIKDFQDNYILINGKEQIGKTSLANMLYLHYCENEYYPILIKGKDISGKANMKSIIKNLDTYQYDNAKNYLELSENKRILIIDDIHDRTSRDTNYANFIEEIYANFKYAIIFIDELYNLSNKSTAHNSFKKFNDYKIKSLGHKKRNELLKKCIANDNNAPFDIEDIEQLATLDKDTAHINNIIGSNIVPSYPIYIISTFNIVESQSQNNMSETSYGHCYHAMITQSLYKAHIQAKNMEIYFNVLTELSYFMFNLNKKSINKKELDIFFKKYKKTFLADEAIIKNIIDSHLLLEQNDTYTFQYIYIYYYFIAKYISDNINKEHIKEHIITLMSEIHKKDNSNIIIFVTHHSKNSPLLDDILCDTMFTFENIKEATLDTKETSFIAKAINKAKNSFSSENEELSPDKENNIELSRNKDLNKKDKLSSTNIETKEESSNKELEILEIIEIRKSAKNIEIIGQIMKNQCGSLPRTKLSELFETGQDVGLRLIKSFINLIDHETKPLDEYIKSRLSLIEENKKSKNKFSSFEKSKEIIITQEELDSTCSKIVSFISYGVIFGWLDKIVNSLGYDKLIPICDEVNEKTNTIASELINFSIHAWHAKKIDIKNIKRLIKRFDKNIIAKHILKDIISRHIYMHKVDYAKQQQISELFKLSVEKQRYAQSRIYKG